MSLLLTFLGWEFLEVSNLQLQDLDLLLLTPGVSKIPHLPWLQIPIGEESQAPGYCLLL